MKIIAFDKWGWSAISALSSKNSRKFIDVGDAISIIVWIAFKRLNQAMK